MKTAHVRLLGPVCLVAALAPAVASAQPAKSAPVSGTVEVRGEVPKPAELKVSELAALGSVNTTWTVHGQTHAVVGVPLEKVLRHCGWEPGVMSKTLPPAQKRTGYKLAVVATAPDGFQAVFSTAELTEGMGKTQALLIWMVDGKPIPAPEGPLRLIVASDGEPSRSLYHLSRLDVVDLRRIVPVAPPPK